MTNIKYSKRFKLRNGERVDFCPECDYHITDTVNNSDSVEERDKGYWIDIDLDTSICSVCKNPQEYETKYCPECGAKMDGDNNVK